jgi:hypothetical protein
MGCEYTFCLPLGCVLPFSVPLLSGPPFSRNSLFPRNSLPLSWGIIIPTPYSTRDDSWGIFFLGESNAKVPQLWVTDGCGFGWEPKKPCSYFLGRYVPHGRKRIHRVQIHLRWNKLTMTKFVNCGKCGSFCPPQGQCGGDGWR